jgi:LysR family transcriptional regulator, transcriptional activator for bauABCD operon
MFGTLSDSDIKLLRVFYVIAQCGGFSAAQAQLNLSQSAISTRMAQLEARLGCRLCERGRGTFRLTSEGNAVLLASRKLFASLEDFRTEVAEAQGSVTGELRIGVIDNSVTHEDERVFRAIAAFATAAPNARLSIVVGGAVELEQQVLDNRLHLAIGLFHHELESLEYTALFREEHSLYCARQHQFFGLPDAEITADRMREARYVSWGYGEGLPGWQPPYTFKDVASSPYVEGVAYLILSGAYIGYLPSHYARFWVAERRIRPILAAEISRSVEFSLVRKRSARVTRLVRAFLDGLGLPPAPAA